MIPLICGKP